MPFGEDQVAAVLLDKRDQVTVDSVRTHTTKHFPVQQAAHATYREILERRARENQVNFVEGVATALTPMAFYAVVMNKSFRTLADDGTEVSVETGLRAAEKLQSVLDGRERDTDILELKVQLGQISEAVRSVVPQSMWAAIVEKLEELEQRSEALDVGEDGFDDADDDPLRPDRVHRRRRRVLTSATPAVTDGDGTAAGVDGTFAGRPPGSVLATCRIGLTERWLAAYCSHSNGRGPSWSLNLLAWRRAGLVRRSEARSPPDQRRDHDVGRCWIPPSAERHALWPAVMMQRRRDREAFSETLEAARVFMIIAVIAQGRIAERNRATILSDPRSEGGPAARPNVIGAVRHAVEGQRLGPVTPADRRSAAPPGRTG